MKDARRVMWNRDQAIYEKESVLKALNGLEQQLEGLLCEIRWSREKVEAVGGPENTGCGMSDEVLRKIFEPLYSTKGFGVGLGMPTVMQIMEQHYGGIDVETKPNVGTSITLWLPVSNQNSC